MRVSNNVAQNLYHKYTFKEAGVRRKYYTDNNEDAYIMWSDEISKLSFRELFKKNKADLLQKLANRGELASPAGTIPQIDPTKLLVVPEVHEGPYVQPPPISGPIATEETLSHSETSEKNR